MTSLYARAAEWIRDSIAESARRETAREQAARAGSIENLHDYIDRTTALLSDLGAADKSEQDLIAALARWQRIPDIIKSWVEENKAYDFVELCRNSQGPCFCGCHRGTIAIEKE